MKQLFDVSSILDRIDDLSVVRKTYQSMVPIELGYRGLDHLTANDVLDDAFNTALNICLHGGLSRQEYEYLTSGAQRVDSFIIVEHYSMEKAVRDAAKVAYLTRLIRHNFNTVTHYSPEMDEILIPQTIEDLSLNKLNRIKKISLEAFFYLKQVEELQK